MCACKIIGPMFYEETNSNYHIQELEDFFGGGGGWRLLKFQDRSFVMHEEILSEGMKPV